MLSVLGNFWANLPKHFSKSLGRFGLTPGGTAEREQTIGTDTLSVAKGRHCQIERNKLPMYLSILSVMIIFLPICEFTLRLL